MDRQEVQGMAGNAANEANRMASDAATSAQAALDQGKTMIEDWQSGATETVEKAKTLAREVGKQASQAATNFYEQSATARGYVTQFTAEQPVAALMIAGALGYGLAYLIHRR